ncbi:MAG: YqgE/AlgH family protein [Thermodesulfobacteriota bacterium]
MQSLQGYFLIATPQMPDPRFQEQVVYLCAHNAEGAMGLVINRPFPDIRFGDVLASLDMQPPAGPLPPVYMGGPVELNSGHILYTSDYRAENFLKVSETVHLSRDIAILQDIAAGRGPHRYLFCLGYAGWAPGQLEEELRMDGWLTLPGENEVLFHPEDDRKWKLAARKFGIDIAVFGDVIGSA